MWYQGICLLQKIMYIFLDTSYQYFFWDFNLNPWWPLGIYFFFHGIELPNIIIDFIIV